jgi:hypothetical protein
MGTASAAAVRKAKNTGAQKWTPKSTNVHKILPFELFLRTIWPVDRTKNYMRLTGAKLHTAKHRVAGNRDPDYAEVVAVLRSEHGFEFLQHVIGDATPKWWRGVQKARGLGDMRRQLAEQQRRIAQLEMAID